MGKERYYVQYMMQGQYGYSMKDFTTLSRASQFLNSLTKNKQYVKDSAKVITGFELQVKEKEVV